MGGKTRIRADPDPTATSPAARWRRSAAFRWPPGDPAGSSRARQRQGERRRYRRDRHDRAGRRRPGGRARLRAPRPPSRSSTPFPETAPGQEDARPARPALPSTSLLFQAPERLTTPSCAFPARRPAGLRESKRRPAEEQACPPPLAPPHGESDRGGVDDQNTVVRPPAAGAPGEPELITELSASRAPLVSEAKKQCCRDGRDAGRRRHGGHRVRVPFARPRGRRSRDGGPPAGQHPRRPGGRRPG